jgi:hypothetical protein
MLSNLTFPLLPIGGNFEVKKTNCQDWKGNPPE